VERAAAGVRAARVARCAQRALARCVLPRSSARRCEAVRVAVKHCASLPNTVRGFLCVLNVMRGHILRTVI
jgi:hypothetical protein